MSVIKTGELSETTGQYEVLCFKCDRPVGWATRAELSEMTARGTEVLCFECEGAWSDIVPECLIPNHDDVIILRDINGEARLAGVWLEGEYWPRYVRVRGGAGLSSSPYLPTSDEDLEQYIAHYKEHLSDYSQIRERFGLPKLGGQS